MKPIVELSTHPERFITPRQLANYLQCDHRTVLRMLEAGHLHGVKVGRRWRIPVEEARRAFPDRASRHTA